MVTYLVEESVTYAFDVLRNSDASCRYSIGKSEVVASVHGPIEARSTAASADGLVCDITVRRSSGVPTGAERYIEVLFQSLLPRLIETVKYPYAQLLVSIEILSDAGSTYAAAFNAMVFALLRSGLAVKQIILASSVAQNENQLALNPSKSSEMDAAVAVTLFIDVESGGIIDTASSHGKCTLQNLQQFKVEAVRSVREQLKSVTERLAALHPQTQSRW